MPPLAQVGAAVVDVVVLAIVVVDVVGGSVTVVVVVLVVVVGGRVVVVVVGGGAVVVVVGAAQAAVVLASMMRLSMNISLRFVMSASRRSIVVAVLLVEATQPGMVARAQEPAWQVSAVQALISKTRDLNVASACRSL